MSLELTQLSEAHCNFYCGMENIKEILAGINVPYPARKVYVSLLEKGKASARTLSLRTGITRTSVYDQIKVLRDKGLISERIAEGTTFFEVNDVRKLSVMLNDQIEKLNVQKDFLAKNIHKLIDKSQTAQPKVRFFEGKDGAQQLLKDVLWYEDTTLYLYWPYFEMLNFLGKDFLAWFSNRRKVRNISIKTIWGNRAEKIKNNIFIDDGSDVERRYLTGKNLSPMGFMIYDNKVAFISSLKESFGFIVESTEFTDLQKMQFDILWNVAKK